MRAAARTIAALLQEREAMLHGIREGVLGYDRNERLILANDSAQRLLRLQPDFLGRPLRELLPPGRLGDVVSGKISGSDLLVLQDDRILVVNRMPIRHDHRRHLGWVVTLHDRTESESLMRELDDAIGLTEALRPAGLAGQSRPAECRPGAWRAPSRGPAHREQGPICAHP